MLWMLLLSVATASPSDGQCESRCNSARGACEGRCGAKASCSARCGDAEGACIAQCHPSAKAPPSNAPPSVCGRGADGKPRQCTEKDMEKMKQAFGKNGHMPKNPMICPDENGMPHVCPGWDKKVMARYAKEHPNCPNPESPCADAENEKQAEALMKKSYTDPATGQ